MKFIGWKNVQIRRAGIPVVVVLGIPVESLRGERSVFTEVTGGHVVRHLVRTAVDGHPGLSTVPGVEQLREHVDAERHEWCDGTSEQDAQ